MKRLTPILGSAAVALGVAVLIGNEAAARAPANDNHQPLIAEQIAPMLNVRSTKFHFLDLNGDGYIVPDEIGKDDVALRSQFASLDANGDGKLSEQEYVLSHRAAID